MEDYIDKEFTYRGKNSKNSIIGNQIRKELSSLALEVDRYLPRTKKERISDGEIKKKVKRYLKDYKVLDLSGGAKMNPLGKWVTMGEDKGDNTLSHELGHGIAFKDPKSNNSKWLDMEIKMHEEGKDMRDHKYYLTGVRAEREAWVEGRKLLGRKETKREKIERKLALNTYERSFEENEMKKAFENDPKYLKAMMKRTGKKLGGGLVGGGLAYLAAKYLTRSEARKLKALKSINKPTNSHILQIDKLTRKIKLKRGAATAVGAIGGYTAAKKYLT